MIRLAYFLFFNLLTYFFLICCKCEHDILFVSICKTLGLTRTYQTRVEVTDNEKPKLTTKLNEKIYDSGLVFTKLITDFLQIHLR